MPLEQRVGLFTAQYDKDNISLKNKRQVCLQFVIKYLSSLNLRLLRYNGTHYICGIFLAPFPSPPWSWGTKGNLKNMYLMRLAVQWVRKPSLTPGILLLLSASMKL